MLLSLKYQQFKITYIHLYFVVSFTAWQFSTYIFIFIEKVSVPATNTFPALQGLEKQAFSTLSAFLCLIVYI